MRVVEFSALTPHKDLPSVEIVRLAAKVLIATIHYSKAGVVE